MLYFDLSSSCFFNISKTYDKIPNITYYAIVEFIDLSLTTKESGRIPVMSSIDLTLLSETCKKLGSIFNFVSLNNFSTDKI